MFLDDGRRDLSIQLCATFMNELETFVDFFVKHL